MSHTSPAIKNKKQKTLRVYSQQYLFDPNEPAERAISDSPKELEAELLENSKHMRRQFRFTVQKMRSRYTSAREF